MLEGPKLLWNLHESTFSKLSGTSDGYWLGKRLLFVIFEVLWIFVKTLTAGDKYSLGNIWNLQDLIQMQLSKEVKTFCWVFSPFLKSASIFRYCETKDDSPSLCISEITDCQRHA